MAAPDRSDLYLAVRPDEKTAGLATPIERWLRGFGWNGFARTGPPPPPELPPLDGPHVGVVFDPPLSAAQFSQAVANAAGLGRAVRVPVYDAALRVWRWSGTDRDFALRGLTLHPVTDTMVAMAGSLFALIPGQPPTALYFGPPAAFAELIWHQTSADRVTVVIAERIEFARNDRPPKGAPLRGTGEVTDAPVGSVLAIAAEFAGALRTIPGSFRDLDAARAALEASNERAIVLFARIVERFRID